MNEMKKLAKQLVGVTTALRAQVVKLGEKPAKVSTKATAKKAAAR